MGKSERSVAFCKLPDPGLLAAAEWEPLRAVSHRLSEPAIMETGPDFATSVCPPEIVFLFGNCSAEKYRKVHNFGETACNLKWAVSPSPQCSAAAGWRRGPRPVEPCCLPKSGSKIVREPCVVRETSSAAREPISPSQSPQLPARGGRGSRRQ